MNDIREKVLLVGVLLDSMNEDDYYLSISELASLSEACYMQVVGQIEQKLDVLGYHSKCNSPLIVS